MREHKVSLTQESNDNTYEQEQEQVLQTMQTAVRQSLTQSKQALQKSFETTAGWVDKTVQRQTRSIFKLYKHSTKQNLGTKLLRITLPKFS